MKGKPLIWRGVCEPPQSHKPTILVNLAEAAGSDYNALHISMTKTAEMSSAIPYSQEVDAPRNPTRLSVHESTRKST